MPTHKVVLFGPFSKIESKIRKISKFQNNTEIALVNEFHQNLRQMKDLDPYFQKKLNFLIFDHFCVFYSILNIGNIRIFENDEKNPICSLHETIFSKIDWILFKKKFYNFLELSEIYKKLASDFDNTC